MKGYVIDLRELNRQVELAGRIREEIILIYPNLLLMSYWDDADSVKTLANRIKELHNSYSKRIQEIVTFARKINDKELQALLEDLQKNLKKLWQLICNM